MAVFKDRLAEALAIRGMKATDLSQKTGVAKSTISEYLSGRMQPKTIRIMEIAKALDVQEAWLIGYDVPMEKVTEREQKIREIEEMINELRPALQNSEVIKKLQGLSPEHQKVVSDLISALAEAEGHG